MCRYLRRPTISEIGWRTAFVSTCPATALLVAIMLSVSCDSPPAYRTEGVDTTDAQAIVRLQARVQKADSLAERLIARSDSILQSIQPFSSREEQLFRRFGQNDHLAYARRLGIDRLPDRRAAGELMGEPLERSGVVRLRTNDFYIIDPRMSFAVALAAPSAAHLMERIGRRFQEDLLAKGLPPYLFIVTNILRTGSDHADLRGINVNAAQGTSAHEYGTTFDIYYDRFHYGGAHDSLARRAARSLEIDEARRQRRLREGYRRLGRTRAAELKAILGRTLLGLQADGLVLAMYERQQPVFHVTVARAVENPPTGARAGASGEVAAIRRFYANMESQLSDVDDDIEDLEEQAEESGGDSQQRIGESLTQIKRTRDVLWQELDRIDGLSAPAFREARSDLRRKVAELEGRLARKRLESEEGKQGVQHRLQTHLQNAGRALSQLEAQVENAPRAIRVRYEEQVSNLRAQHADLEGRLQTLEGTSEMEMENARAEAIDAASRLVADLQVVVADVNDAD